MLLDEPERKLSIYAAEIPSKVDGMLHAALLLVDETTHKPSIVQHLHFGDYKETSKDGTSRIIMIPFVRDGMNSETEASIAHQYPIIRGHERDILDAWNHMLAHALEVRERKLTFDYDTRDQIDALNCRMGIISALELIGIKIDMAFFKDISGTSKNRIQVSEVFSLFNQPREELEIVREQNTALSEALPRPEQQDWKTVLGAAIDLDQR